jgi:hypothetical protein
MFDRRVADDCLAGNAYCCCVGTRVGERGLSVSKQGEMGSKLAARAREARSASRPTIATRCSKESAHCQGKRVREQEQEYVVDKYRVGRGSGITPLHDAPQYY